MTSHRLVRARELAGLSLAQANRLLGWQGTTTLIDMESGDIPGDGTMRQLADLYGCSVEWLRGEEVEPPADLVKALRDKGVSDHDRDAVLEFAAMIQSRPPVGTAREALARVRARREATPAAQQPVSRRRAYVRSQGQTRNHHCHWPGCDKQVPPAMWGCRGHWFRLPKTLRDRIWRTYTPGQEVDMTPSEEYLRVADDVQRWIREHGGTR